MQEAKQLSERSDVTGQKVAGQGACAQDGWRNDAKDPGIQNLKTRG